MRRQRRTAPSLPSTNPIEQVNPSTDLPAPSPSSSRLIQPLSPQPSPPPQPLPQSDIGLGKPQPRVSQLEPFQPATTNDASSPSSSSRSPSLSPSTSEPSTPARKRRTCGNDFVSVRKRKRQARCPLSSERKAAASSSSSDRRSLRRPSTTLCENHGPSSTTAHPAASIHRTPLYRSDSCNDEPASDVLPQLSLLSATRTAPIGWLRPTIKIQRHAPFELYDQINWPLDPEQQRYWPIIDQKLDYTGARMLSNLADCAARDVGSPPYSLASSPSTFDDPSNSLPSQWYGYTSPSLSIKLHRYQLEGSAGEARQMSATLSSKDFDDDDHHKDSPTTPETHESAQSGVSRCSIDSCKLLPYEATRPGVQPSSPATTLAAMIKYTRARHQQSIDRQNDQPLGSPSEISTSSCSPPSSPLKPDDPSNCLSCGKGRYRDGKTKTDCIPSCSTIQPGDRKAAQKGYFGDWEKSYPLACCCSKEPAF